MSNNDSDSPDNAGTRVRATPGAGAPDRTQVRAPSASEPASPDQGATLYRSPLPSDAPASDANATLIAPRRDVKQPSDSVSGTPAKPPEPTLVKSDATAVEPGTFDVGGVIRDRFVLESLLGRGGMGIVFAALDRRKEEARDPNPHIAIKILNADFRSHPDSLVALQREARKAQTLAHPNVVTVFDFDRDGASVYMTMERLRGRSLDAMVREARGRGIGREAALPIIRGIAEGLAYAHRKGIVHSDLKPGNVFVVEDGTPKILDFGIARAVPSAAATEKDTFDAGSLGAYTEAYATAEMVEGIDPHPSDDVYALGLIAYELLVGQHPFNRMSAPAARKKGIKAAAPKILKMREWRALEATLSFERSQRPKDAADFLKRFYGVTPLKKSLVAAAVAMAVLAGYFGYSSYQAAGPVVPFDALPVETQTQFKDFMAGGDREWQFFEKDKNLMALWDATDQYADAYRLHPRNRQASSALKRSADAFLDATRDDPDKQREVAEALAAKSDYLAKYDPISALRPGK